MVVRLKGGRISGTRAEFDLNGDVQFLLQVFFGEISQVSTDAGSPGGQICVVGGR